MGCCPGKSSQVVQPVAPHTPRRRLSVESVEANLQADQNDEDVGCEEDRSLLVQLTQDQLIDFLGEKRKYSICSETDKELHMSSSFSTKATVFNGDMRFKDDGAECIGYACKKGLKPEAPNQDSFFICKVESSYSIYGVFDGHGRKGHDISNFVKEYLPKVLLKRENLLKEPIQALKEAFDKTQRLIEQATGMKKIDASRSGSTASVILHDHQKRMLYIAHVGDSRCVLGKSSPSTRAWEAVDLTEDHKPNLPNEKARIERNGGTVRFDGGYNYRVYAKGKRYPGLNMSRAMGDLMGFHDAGISAVPDVNKTRIHTQEGTNAAQNKEKRTSSKESEAPSFAPSLSSHSIDPLTDKFLLLCSDGVWEFTSSDEAVEVVAGFNANQSMDAAERLATESWDRWMRHMQGEVVDDITALVVYFKPSMIHL